MIRNSRWTPEVPRPTLNDEHLFVAFLKEWVEKEYKDEVNSAKEYFGEEEFDIEDFGIYQSILKEWIGDNEDTAENLIKRQGWDYRQAKEFEEKNLEYDFDKENNRLSKQWVTDNVYTLPFSVGSRVKWGLKEGIIMEDKNNNYLPFGKVCVLTDKQAAENKKWQDQGISSRHGGYIVNWESLELIEEKQ